MMTSTSFAGILVLAAFVVSAIGWIAYRGRGRNLRLFYDSESTEGGHVHRRVLETFRDVMSCSRKEFVCEGRLEGRFQSIRTVSATSSVALRAPGLETNVPVPILTSAHRSIYLMPDCILACDGRGRRAKRVAYGDLVVESGRSPVVETSPADDATVISSSRIGGVAVALYDWIRLSTAGGEIALIQFSKAGSTLGFADALRDAGAKLERA